MYLSGMSKPTWPTANCWTLTFLSYADFMPSTRGSLAAPRFLAWPVLAGLHGIAAASLLLGLSEVSKLLGQSGLQKVQRQPRHRPCIDPLRMVAMATCTGQCDHDVAYCTCLIAYLWIGVTGCPCTDVQDWRALQIALNSASITYESGH